VRDIFGDAIGKVAENIIERNGIGEHTGTLFKVDSFLFV
jgi:hypothetical protein